MRVRPIPQCKRPASAETLARPEKSTFCETNTLRPANKPSVHRKSCFCKTNVQRPTLIREWTSQVTSDPIFAVAVVIRTKMRLRGFRARR